MSTTATTSYPSLPPVLSVFKGLESLIGHVKPSLPRRSASSYFVPSMCPSVPQSELLRANWPPTIGPSEALLGLSVEMIPAPRGAFERLMARLSDVFQVLEGAWRCSDAAMSSGAGVLIRPRDLSFGSHVLLLVRMDDTGR